MGVFFFFGFNTGLKQILGSSGGVLYLIIAGALGAACYIGVKAFAPVKVIIDHTFVRVSRGLLLNLSGEIRKDALEELNINDKKLTAVSDRQQLVIPVYTANQEDVTFVHETILYHLNR